MKMIFVAIWFKNPQQTFWNKQSCYL